MEYDEVLSGTDFSDGEQSEEALQVFPANKNLSAVSKNLSNFSDMENDEVLSEQSKLALRVFPTNENLSPGSEIKHFNVLCFNDIRRRQENAIQQVSSLCCVSPSKAATLLRHFMWCVANLTEEWFADEQKVRSATGLLENFPITKSSEDQTLFCEICMEFFSRKNMKALACGHYFCCECWKQYIHTSIDNDGLGSLNLRCPHPECDVVVGEDMVLSIVTDKKYRAKFEGYLVRSYVEQNRRMKGCPAPGCDFAVEFVGGREWYDVVCKCSHTFCWNCLEENHRPVDCETVRKWALKNRDAAVSYTWISVNSKSCPKCNRRIEKIDGCMHMICAPPCYYEFCWRCGGDWDDKIKHTNCNMYEMELKKLRYKEEKEKELVRQSLKRYEHYYERWVANESSKAKTVKKLQQIKDVKIHTLSDKDFQTVGELKFVIDAWLQIIECRRVLKWTYAYGYFLSERDDRKKKAFEYAQGFAERAVEELHECAETELRNFVECESSSNDFLTFRMMLESRTNATRTFFENLVQSLENGLSLEKLFNIVIASKLFDNPS